MSHWEKIIKDHLADAGWEVPAGSWEALQAQRAGLARKRGRRNAAIWTASAAAALAILLVLSIPARRPEENLLSKAGTSDSVQPAEASVPTESLPLVPEEAGTPSTPVVTHPATRVLAVTPAPQAPILPEEKEDLPASPSPSQETEEAESAPEEMPQNEPVVSPSFEERLRAEGRLASTRPERKVSVTAGGLLAAVRHDAPHSMPMMDASANPNYASSSPYTRNIPDLRRIASRIAEQDHLVGTLHHRPLEFGLTAGIPLSNRWTVVTGLEYDLYRSRFSYTLSGVQEQEAHYLGIPLSMHYNLVCRNGFQLYLGAGVKGDWGLWAKRNGEKIQTDGFGWSLQALGGLQWNIGSTLGLYLEPRYSWFLSDTEGRIKTFRTESPNLFSLSAGLRFRL